MRAGETSRAREALGFIPADIPRDEWVRVGMAAHAAGLTLTDFQEWSAQAESYDERAARDTWKSIKPGKIGAGTLYKLAQEHGFKDGKAKPTAPKSTPAKVSGTNAAAVWSRCKPATASHHYVIAKRAAEVPLDGLRVLPDKDPLRIADESMGGALVVPVRRQDGTLASLQFIAPPETADRLKAKGKPGKLNLPGASLEGWFTVGEIEAGGVAHVCEGIGQAWACWQATGESAVVAFGWGRVRSVTTELQKHYPETRLVLVPDAGKEADAKKIAAELGVHYVTMPEGWPSNSDVSDLAQRDGLEALDELLCSHKVPDAPPLPLNVVFADELPTSYEPPDELVEGLLTNGAGSMLYGDSNSGKTYFCIDLACAVARGVDWMGRRTEQGLVIYIAAESPASVRSRLQAYQMHHRCTVPNFAIVQAPLDLFHGDHDTDALIELVRAIERQKGEKARLIIGDTLARLSAGANENSGEDMGLVVKRFDRIRHECAAHFLLIHHSGKAAAAGARGWSGVRAAVDTEIEVTDTPTGRCAEITKQRDISTKGDRIGFYLQSVTMGETKWGAPATTCVVMPTDAPARPMKGKRLGPTEGAVLEFMQTQNAATRVADLARHFDGQYARQSIYRAVYKLENIGQVRMIQHGLFEVVRNEE